MGDTGMTPWNVLSGAIRKKVADAQDRQQKVKDQQRDTEYKAWDGILMNPNSTPEEREQAQDAMKKLVPKDVHPLIDAYHKVSDIIHSKRKQAQAQAQAQTQAQGGQAAPGQAPGQAPAAGNAPSGAPAAPSGPPDLAKVLSAQNSPDRQQQTVVARRKAEMQGEYQALSDIYGQDQAKEMMRKKYEGTAGRSRIQKVTVTDPENGKPTIADHNLDTGQTMLRGKLLDNPEIVSWVSKPTKAWGKDATGFYSFMMDPFTGHPLPGSMDRAGLPPPGYLDRIRNGWYTFTNDSGEVISVPMQTETGPSVPKTEPGKAAGTSASATSPTPAAVPKSMRGPGKKSASTTTSPATDTSTGLPGGAKHQGTKDTGVLSAQGQKVLMSTTPVVQQLDRMLADIDKYELGDNNTPGYLTGPYIEYKFGRVSPKPLAEDIAGLSLGSVIEAASTLQGSSRSISALKIALQHTPDPKIDSPKMIKSKLTEIRKRLQDVINDAKIYGRKRSTATATSGDIPSSSSGSSKGDGTSENPIVLQNQ